VDRPEQAPSEEHEAQNSAELIEASLVSDDDSLSGLLSGLDLDEELEVKDADPDEDDQSDNDNSEAPR